MPEITNPLMEKIMNRWEWIGVLKLIAKSEDKKLFIRLYMLVFSSSQKDAIDQFNKIQN